MRKLLTTVFFSIFLLTSCVSGYSTTTVSSYPPQTTYTLYYHNYPVDYYNGCYYYWNNYRWIYIDKRYHHHICSHPHRPHHYKFNYNRPIRVTKPYNPNHKHHKPHPSVKPGNHKPHNHNPSVKPGNRPSRPSVKPNGPHMRHNNTQHNRNVGRPSSSSRPGSRR